LIIEQSGYVFSLSISGLHFMFIASLLSVYVYSQSVICLVSQ